MPVVRTDKGALLTAGAFAAAFLFFNLRNYLLVLPEGMRSWDLMLVWLAMGALLYVGLFLGGHLLFRRAGIAQRWAYALLGAGCLTLLKAVMMGPFALLAAFQSGMGVAGFIFPALLGATFAFLYAWRAGWEDEEDLPALEAAAAAHPLADGRLEAGPSTYFDGPVQVRTSIPLMMLAAVLGSLLSGLVKGALTIGHEVSLLASPSLEQALVQAGEASAAAGFMAFGMTIIGAPAMFVVVLIGHHVARAFKWSGYGPYMAIGLVAPVLVALVSMFLFLPIAVMIMVPTAVAMAIYRNFAGLEPVPVREDIQVGDPRHLVGANHPRRQFGRVVRTR